MNKHPKSIFISHGGGPLPLLGDPQHKEMVDALRALSQRIPQPKAIVVVSAHWEADVPTVTSAKTPELIYDYYGFPPESYEIEYPCHGEPTLAQDVYNMLESKGIKAAMDEQRGLDHGVFVPLKIMYPDANIPCVQLSLVKTSDPETHIAIGRALQHLHEQGVLLIGSGFSFHNMRAFFSAHSDESEQQNRAFEDWLADTCGNQDYSASQRSDLLQNWSEAPAARYCHPREEHLLPLHVCYGVAEAASSERIELSILNKISSLYIW